MLSVARRFANASLLILLSTVAFAQSAKAAQRVVVLPTTGSGVDAADFSDVDGMIGIIIGGHRAFEVVASTDANAALDRADSKRPGCVRDEACVAGIARDLHADFAVLSAVGRNGAHGLSIDVWVVSASGAPSKHAAETMKKKQSMQMNLEQCLKTVFQFSSADAAVSASPPGASIAPEPAKPKAPEKRRVMVLDLLASGVDAQIASPLSEIIAREIGQHGGYDVASSDDVRRIMGSQAEKQAVGCTKDEECLVEISRKLQADLIVNGSVGQIGSSYVVNLALMNPKEMSKASGASETVSRLDDLPKAAAACVAKIFKWNGAATGAAFHLPKGRKMSFAIMDLKPTGISLSSAQNLTQVLSVEVKGVEGASVISREDISSMLQLNATKMEVGCGDDACMSEIGGALGVDRLVAGDVGKIGESFIVNLRLIDVRHGNVENRVTESYRGDEDQLLRAVRHSGRELLGLPMEGDGKLAITASCNGATVFVDDLKKGIAPIPVDGLKVGRHDVRVSHDGWYDWHSEIYVDPMETTSVWAQLKEQPPQWFQKWWVWTIAGAVIAGGTTAAIVATRPAPTTSHGTVVIQ